MLIPTTFWKAASAASISIGRSNVRYVSGSGTDFTIGWASGGAAANGTWLVAVIGEVTGATAPLITGGSTWTRLGSTKCYYKQCGASEPTTYTVKYVGASKSEATAVAIIEVIGANSMEASASATGTNAAPSVTTTAATDCIILAMQQNTGSSPTPPSGYTLGTTTSLINASAAVASKLNVGSGSISPGNWGASYGSLHTLAFKV